MRPLRFVSALVAAAAICLGCAGGDGPGTPPVSSPVSPSVGSPGGRSPAATVRADVRQLERDIHAAINERRRINGLDPLEDREDVARVARDYSELMLERDFFSHTGPGGGTIEDRVREADVSFTAVGENLSKTIGAPNPVENSPGHRENILREVFTQTGIGVAMDGGTFYATQIFLTP